MSRIEVLSPEKFEVLKVPRQKKEMPLSFVPKERRPFYSTEVAGHELNHALVAMALGAPIASLSVIPEGNSLGRTIIGGASSEAMKVIAAGGGVGTHEGRAQGYGSDKFKVDFMHHFHGGSSWDGAKSQAESIISMFSNEVRAKAAEIIAYLGSVPGSLIGDIVRRAQMEVDEEKGTETGFDSQFFKSIDQPENYTIIDDLEGGVQKITYIIVGKKEKEEFLCTICHAINTHKENCPNAKLKKPEEENPFSLPKLVLPKEGIIFSTN